METNQNDHDLLIKLNTNVENLLGTVNAHIEANNKLTDDHEKRLRFVEAENQQSKGAQKSMKTIMAVGGFIITVINALIAYFVPKG